MILGCTDHSRKFSWHLLTRLLLTVLLFSLANRKKREMEKGRREQEGGQDERGAREINSGLLYEVEGREAGRKKGDSGTHGKCSRFEQPRIISCY